MLSKEDQFTRNWSRFDIDSRLQKEDGTKEELLQYISSQASEWTNEEKIKLNSIIEEIDKIILKQGFKLPIPDEVFLVKTTAKEEVNSDGYTRQNFIVLREDVGSWPDNQIKNTIIHELFHILTRNNSGFKKKLYQIIGFKLINDISFPENLKDLKITNPDSPIVDSYIELIKDDEPIECAMIIYSKEKYTGGDFFKYLNVGFLKLKGDTLKEIDYQKGEPVIFTFDEVTDFFEQIGKNTQYIIQPEEIMAVNFTFAVLDKKGLPTQHLVEKIQDKLRE